MISSLLHIVSDMLKQEMKRVMRHALLLLFAVVVAIASVSVGFMALFFALETPLGKPYAALVVAGLMLLLVLISLLMAFRRAPPRANLRLPTNDTITLIASAVAAGIITGRKISKANADH